MPHSHQFWNQVGHLPLSAAARQVRKDMENTQSPTTPGGITHAACYRLVGADAEHKSANYLNYLHLCANPNKANLNALGAYF
jgi:hypothetical protein